MVRKGTTPNSERARRLVALKGEIAGVCGGVKVTDPVYDTLLHLYIAEEESMPMSVSAVAPLTGIPATTCLRWIGQMENAGLIVRTRDSGDARRTWICLSADCKARLNRLIENLG